MAGFAVSINGWIWVSTEGIHGDGVDIDSGHLDTVWQAIHDAVRAAFPNACIETKADSGNSHVHVDWRPNATQQCPNYLE